MATITASAVATTVIARRAVRPRRRPRHNAHAAKHAAAAAECPLGNDIPETWTSWSKSGRGRPTIAFARLFANPTPTTTTARNTTTPRVRVRTTSTVATTIVITNTPTVLPRSVNRPRTRVLVSVACRAAQRATWRSTRATKDCRRTSNPRTATTTSMRSATVNASPVTSAGVTRPRRNDRNRWCTSSSCCTALAVAWTGPRVTLVGSRFTTTKTSAARAPATTPESTNTMSTDIASPASTEQRGSSRAVARATALREDEEG